MSAFSVYAQQKTIQLAPLDAAKLLIANGNYGDAEKILAAILRIDSTNTDALFLEGQIAGKQNNWQRAADIYLKILKDHPELTRVRLEYALALFMLKQDERAEYNFRLAAAAPNLPPTVLANINTFLNQIRARRNWQLSVNASVVPNTNMNAAPAISQVTLFGLPFQLSQTAKQQSGTGVAVTALGEYDFHLSDRYKLRTGASLYRVDYPNKPFDDLITEAYVGPRWLHGDVDVSVLGVLNRRWYSNDPYSVSGGPRIETNWNATPRLRFENMLEYLQQWYSHNFTYLNGYLVFDNLNTLYAFSPTSFVRFATGLGYQWATDPSWTNWFYRLGVGYHRELSWGISIEERPEFWQFAYNGVQPLFGFARNDYQVRNILSVNKRDWELWGFSPVISYIFTDNMSNTPLYSYTQHLVQIGFTKLF